MFAGVKIEKDPFFASLNQQVFSKLSELHNEITIEQGIKDTNTIDSVRFVSFEEALKELVDLKNS